ncbi:MAG: S49 family peptidase [Anaerolineae bacterium]|nr:S49 family peptidase [Anaerolineae bacterium]MDW8070188.1 S49 family peptidase [Anaerolineae bacterium]
MRPRLWRIGVELIFLLTCLAIGLVLSMRFAPRPIIGTMHFEGLIVPPSARQMWNILEAARRDPRVAGIVIEVSSFGGDASSSEKLYHAMAKFRQEKPLVVVIDGEATSGGYYAAIAANKIYATAAAAVGNIGVWMSRPTDPMIVPDVLSTGPYKLGGGSRFDNIRQLEMVKDAFVTTVLHERTQSPYNPLRIDGSILEEGHIYLGSEALALGMVDALGSISDAIADVAMLAGVEQYEVRDLTEYLGLPFQPVDPFQVLGTLRRTWPGEVLLLDTRFIPLVNQETESTSLEIAGAPASPGEKTP